MILHGKVDSIIPPQNSRMLAEMAIRRGVKLRVGEAGTRGQSDQFSALLDGQDRDGLPFLRYLTDMIDRLPR